jgi:hypothetical protein
VPVILPNVTTTDVYPNPGAGGAQLGIGDVFGSGYFVVANASAACEFFRGVQGLQTPSPELFLAPSTYPLQGTPQQPLGGIRFRSAVAGTPAQIFGVLYYPNEATLLVGNEFTSTVSPSGGVTPGGGSNLAILAVSGGNPGNGGTYSITAPATGTFIVGWGAGSWNSAGLGSSGQLTTSVTGGHVARIGTTSGGGGSVFVPGIALTSGTTVTITAAIGDGSNFIDCWAMLIQTA